MDPTVSLLRQEAQKLRDEVSKLEVKRKRLKALEEYLATFPDEAAPESGTSYVEQRDRAEEAESGVEPDFSNTRPKTQKMLLAAYRALNAEGRSLLTRELVQRLEDDGIEIGGQDTVGTLSAALSHHKQVFENCGRNVGWRLRDVGMGKGHS